MRYTEYIKKPKELPTIDVYENWYGEEMDVYELGYSQAIISNELKKHIEQKFDVNVIEYIDANTKVLQCVWFINQKEIRFNLPEYIDTVASLQDLINFLKNYIEKKIYKIL